MADKPPIRGQSPIDVKRERPEVRTERPEAAVPPVRAEREVRPAERAPAPLPASPHPATAPAVKKRGEKSETRKKIEEILAEDLEEVYVSLPAAMRVKFRVEGERAAAKVEALFHKAKLAIIDVIKVIREWLLILPGVNRFFVEQEAKIKADKLIHLHDTKEK